MACGRQRQPDAALIALDGRSADEPCFLEPGDELRHPGHGHALEGGELAHPDSRTELDLNEERDLAAGDPERVDLPPELPVQVQENRAKAVCEDCWIGRDGWHFVNQVN